MTTLSIRSNLRYAATPPCDLLLQIEALSDEGQSCSVAKVDITGGTVTRLIQETPDYGPRRWIDAGHDFAVDYTAEVEISRGDVALSPLNETPRTELPGDVIPYLMPSRYCQSDLFLQFVGDQFGQLKGGEKVQAMADWISSNFTYNPEASIVGGTATDSFQQLAGVCRDYAHVMISLSRAGGIPARFLSAYGPDVTPQDFHAVAEVYLDDDWHIVDPTGMSKASEIARICVGRDAADASFLTSYGEINLIEQTVAVSRLDDATT